MVNGTEPARLPGCTDPPAPPGNEAADAGIPVEEAFARAIRWARGAA